MKATCAIKTTKQSPSLERLGKNSCITEHGLGRALYGLGSEIGQLYAKLLEKRVSGRRNDECTGIEDSDPEIQSRRGK